MIFTAAVTRSNKAESDAWALLLELRPRESDELLP